MEIKKPRGRPKGTKVPEEIKQKIRLTKIRNKLNRQNNIYEKVELLITGKETNGFDYWPTIRKTLRPLYQYDLCKNITKEIVNPKLWQDTKSIKLILEKYFILKVSKNVTKKRIIVKVGRTFTEEQRIETGKRIKAYWEKKRKEKEGRK